MEQEPPPVPRGLQLAGVHEVIDPLLGATTQVSRGFIDIEPRRGAQLRLALRKDLGGPLRDLLKQLRGAGAARAVRRCN